MLSISLIFEESNEIPAPIKSPLLERRFPGKSRKTSTRIVLCQSAILKKDDSGCGPEAVYSPSDGLFFLWVAESLVWQKCGAVELQLPEAVLKIKGSSLRFGSVINEQTVVNAQFAWDFLEEHHSASSLSILILMNLFVI